MRFFEQLDDRLMCAGVEVDYDANGDGLISILDPVECYAEISNYGMGPTTEANNPKTDVNKSGEVTTLDLLETVIAVSEQYDPDNYLFNHVSVKVFEDNNGEPGDWMVRDLNSPGDYTVDLGEKFWVGIFVEEYDHDINGFERVFINLEWYNETIALVQPLEPEVVITEDFTADHSGQYRPHFPSDAIINLGATSGEEGGPIGNQRPELFALLQFEAVGVMPAGMTPIWVTEVDLDVDVELEKEPSLLAEPVIRVEWDVCFFHPDHWSC